MHGLYIYFILPPSDHHRPHSMMDRHNNSSIPLYLGSLAPVQPGAGERMKTARLPLITGDTNPSWLWVHTHRSASLPPQHIAPCRLRSRPTFQPLLSMISDLLISHHPTTRSPRNAFPTWLERCKFWNGPSTVEEGGMCIPTVWDTRVWLSHRVPPHDVTEEAYQPGPRANFYSSPYPEGAGRAESKRI